MRVNRIIQAEKHYEHKERIEVIQKKQYTNKKEILFAEVLKNIRQNGDKYKLNTL